MGIAAGATADRVAAETMIKARDEGRDFAAEGEQILAQAAKHSRELQAAIDTSGGITFTYESTDTPDAPSPRLGWSGAFHADNPGHVSILPDLEPRRSAPRSSTRIDQGSAVAVEFTDDPHPRNSCGRCGACRCSIADASAAMHEVTACIQAWPDQYVRVTAYDATLGRQTTALSFIVSLAGARAGLPPGPAGNRRPADQVLAARLRHGPAERRAVPPVSEPKGARCRLD